MLQFIQDFFIIKNSLLNQMTQKFNYQGYTICVTFRSDNAFSITASYNLTGEHFINDMAELGKIKKDTVLATLARKSQKNLWCTFKMVDSEPRKLVISFVVKFDFLPQFSQDITLQYMEIKGDVFNKISSVQLQSDIQQIEKVLDAIRDKGAITVEQKSSSLNKKTQITNLELNQGKYLFQMTGVFTNATQIADTIEIQIKQEGEQSIKLKQKTHSQHGYAFPYYFSQIIESKGGNVTIWGQNGNGSATLSTQVLTLIPIVGA